MRPSAIDPKPQNLIAGFRVSGLAAAGSYSSNSDPFGKQQLDVEVRLHLDHWQIVWVFAKWLVDLLCRGRACRGSRLRNQGLNLRL